MVSSLGNDRSATGNGATRRPSALQRVLSACSVTHTCCSACSLARQAPCIRKEGNSGGAHRSCGRRPRVSDVKRGAALHRTHAQRPARSYESCCVVCNFAGARCADGRFPGFINAHLQDRDHSEALLRGLHERSTHLRKQLCIGNQPVKRDLCFLGQRLRHELRQPEPRVCLSRAIASAQATGKLKRAFEQRPLGAPLRVTLAAVRTRAPSRLGLTAV